MWSTDLQAAIDMETYQSHGMSVQKIGSGTWNLTLFELHGCWLDTVTKLVPSLDIHTLYVCHKGFDFHTHFDTTVVLRPIRHSNSGD